MSHRKQFSVWLGFTLIIFCLAFAVAQLIAEEAGHGERKGCYVKGYDMAHSSPVFHFFVKTGDKEYDGERGPEVWGYDPEDRSDHGRPMVVNVPEEYFVESGRVKPVHGHLCRCPLW